MSQYGFSTTGKEIVADLTSNVKGRTFLVTGPSQGGLGAQTAISLAHGSPSTIILLGRSISKIQPVIDTIHTIDPSITTKFIPIELANLSSVRAVAKLILEDTSISKIDSVINNAAIMIHPYELSVDGYELQFATNHLSHFLLTNLIMPKILAAGPGSTIVNVSSGGHIFGGINWESTDYNKGADYEEWKSYGQAKTANILFTVSLSEKLKSKGIKSWTLNPGSISTNLQGYLTPALYESAIKVFTEKGLPTPGMKTLDQGCATTVRAAIDSSLVQKDGSVYLDDCQVITDSMYILPSALDKSSAERLWKMSEDMVGQKFPL
jgi:NAD(P)-dependent dehydrogenase (short-subunit alcohol dehydrogenase family)